MIPAFAATSLRLWRLRAEVRATRHLLAQNAVLPLHLQRGGALCASLNSDGGSPTREDESKELNPEQVAALESLLKAGFRFVTFERYARYLAVEREGFVALLETGEGKVKQFGQVGYHLGEGIAMLVERAEGKGFVWKGESEPATPELLAAYERFKFDLRQLLQGRAGEVQ
jgi:hypothetical protein